jgi:HYR domain
MTRTWTAFLMPLARAVSTAATGVDELAPGASLSTAGGSASASFAGAFNPATSAFEGDYAVVLGMLDDQPGIWKQDFFSYVLSDPGTDGGPYVYQIGYISEQMPWQGTLAPGERATNDIRYGFAELCLRIRSPIAFHSPVIIGSGELTGLDSEGNSRDYRVNVSGAYGLPDTAASATNEATVTLYIPEGTYTLQPTITTIDPGGGESYTQLRTVVVSVVARERYCVEECIQVSIEPPICTPTFGFLARANAVSCDGTLTNLSLRASPLFDSSIRLGYSDIRILIGSRTNLTTAHGLFPEFDGFPRSYYEDILYTATAIDNLGRVATRQIIAHYDLTPPTIHCPGDMVVVSSDGASVPVDYTVTATDNRPEPLSIICTPPSGSLFPVGTNTVTCRASDLCRNTNTCTFQVIVGPPSTDCILNLTLTQVAPPVITLTWDCGGTLQCAADVAGPWSDLVGETSPYTTAASDLQKFYRIRIP